MLNCYKKIRVKEKEMCHLSFFQKPVPLKIQLLQKNQNIELLGSSPVVFARTQQRARKWWQKPRRVKKPKKLSFYFFSGIIFRSVILFKKFFKKKKNLSKQVQLKQRLRLVNKIFMKKALYRGFPIRPVKGGFTTTTLGFKSFMPKSHSERLFLDAPIENLIGLKVIQNRKRFSARAKRTKLNFVSSSKMQHKGVRFKKGHKLRWRGFYWHKLATIINKRNV